MFAEWQPKVRQVQIARIRNVCRRGYPLMIFINSEEDKQRQRNSICRHRWR